MLTVLPANGSGHTVEHTTMVRVLGDSGLVVQPVTRAWSPCVSAMTEPERPADAPFRPRRFPTTRWSVVRAAAGTASPEARAALECLCRTYWAPVYAFVRQSGRSADDAQDLTQAFFARVIEKAEGAVRAAVHRLRRRFGRCLRETLADTVDDPADIDAELAYLLDVLSRRHQASLLDQP